MSTENPPPKVNLAELLKCKCDKKLTTNHCPNCHRDAYNCVNMSYRRCFFCHYSMGAPIR